MSSQPAKVNNSIEFLNSVNEPFDSALKTRVNPEMRPMDSLPNVCAPAVKPGNYYLSNDNQVNFPSNVMNVPKFYKINTYDTQLPESPYRGATNSPSPQKVEDNKCFSYPNSGKQVYTEDQWKYQNELPMNGGMILPGLMGFDSDETAFATYSSSAPSPMMTASCDGKDAISCQKEPDDIRFGLGKPNEEYRLTR